MLAATSAPFVPLYAGLAGILRRPVPTLIVDGPAVVVAPHPDDEVAGVGGIVAQHVRSGAPVTVLVCTDGSASRAVPGSATDRAATRRAECEAAQRVLGTGLVWLGVPERLDLDVDDLADRLAPLLVGARVVYAPSRVDFHPGHRAVAAALARVIRDDQEVRAFATSVPIGSLATHVSDIGAVDSIVRGATAAYATQERTLWCMARQRRYVAAFHGVGSSAEAVWVLSGDRYRALHAGPPTSWPDAFRGLRPHALTDPFAWWVGRDERARLADAGRSQPP